MTRPLFAPCSALGALLLLTFTSSRAAADEPPPLPAAPTTLETPPSTLPPDGRPVAPDSTPLTPFPPAEPEPPAVKITPLGYIEAYYAYNFNRPVNGITNYRGYDNRHNSFTLSNAALGAGMEAGPVAARLILQIGSTPSTIYAAEPAQPGAAGANATGPELWKYLQEANVSYRAPIGTGLLLKVGLMPSPIGFESFAVKDNWNWSRSNLFYATPSYRAGASATYELTERLAASVAVVNGWSSVVDNNEGKSVEGHLTYRVPHRFQVKVVYFGGAERGGAAPEGPGWRHQFDATGQVDVTSWLALAAQANYGFEPNRIGTARWYAGAAYARAKALDWLYLAVRGDRFYEQLGTDAAGRASTPLFWNGVEWVSSFTATLDVRPHDNLSFRVELRHDQADGLLYFTSSTLYGDGSAKSPFLPNARSQETLLFGATAWF